MNRLMKPLSSISTFFVSSISGMQSSAIAQQLKAQNTFYRDSIHDMALLEIEAESISEWAKRQSWNAINKEE